jgi:hypothetical protein
MKLPPAPRLLAVTNRTHGTNPITQRVFFVGLCVQNHDNLKDPMAVEMQIPFPMTLV